DDVQGVAPPRISPRSQVVQDHAKVQADLDPDLPLARVVGAAWVALGGVRGRDEQVAQRAEIEIEQASDPVELQIGRVDLVRVIAAPSLDRAAVLAAGGRY